jgi:hypothetical protein
MDRFSAEMEYTSFLYWTNWVDFVVKNYGLS